MEVEASNVEAEDVGKENDGAFKQAWNRGKAVIAFLIGFVFAAGAAWGMQSGKVSDLCRTVETHTAASYPGHPETIRAVEGIRERVGAVEKKLDTHLDQSPGETKTLTALAASFDVFAKTMTERLDRIERKVDRVDRADSVDRVRTASGSKSRSKPAVPVFTGQSQKVTTIQGGNR